MEKLIILLLVPTLFFSCTSDATDDEPLQATCDNGTFLGIARLETQAEVNDFGALCYTKIDGTLVIGPNDGEVSDISDLTPLENINEVLISVSDIGTGKLLIINTSSLINLNGLQNITKAAGILVTNNSGLINFSGLEGIRELASPGPLNDLTIDNNSQLQDLNALQNLTVIGSENSDALTFMIIQNNDNLANLDGLMSLEAVYGDVTIGSYIDDGNLELGNENLTDFCGIFNLVNNGLFNDVNVFNNAFNPTNQDIIDGNCSQ
jgi:hypothetical protein